MVKITALPPMSSPDGADQAPVVDDSVSTTKKLTLTQLKTWLQSLTDFVSTAMLASGSVTLAKLATNIWGWEMLGVRDSVTSGTKTTLDTGTFAAKKHIRILIVQHSGGVALTSGMRFNNDSGSNYAYRTTENGGADSGAGSQTWIQLGVNSLEGMHAEWAFLNNASYRKVGHALETFWDASQNLYRNTIAGYWNNSSNQITRVTLVATAGAYRPGSELIVLGKD